MSFRPQKCGAPGCDVVDSVQPGLLFAVVEMTGEKYIAETVQFVKWITAFDIKAHVGK